MANSTKSELPSKVFFGVAILVGVAVITFAIDHWLYVTREDNAKYAAQAAERREEKRHQEEDFTTIADESPFKPGDEVVYKYASSQRGVTMHVESIDDASKTALVAWWEYGEKGVTTLRREKLPLESIEKPRKRVLKADVAEKQGKAGSK